MTPTGIVILSLFVMGVAIGLEYVIRHATMQQSEDQWKWDKWDTLTVIIVLFVGICVSIFLCCKTTYKPQVTSSFLSTSSLSSPTLSSPSMSNGEIYALSDPSSDIQLTTPNITIVNNNNNSRTPSLSSSSSFSPPSSPLILDQSASSLSSTSPELSPLENSSSLNNSSPESKSDFINALTPPSGY